MFYENLLFLFLGLIVTSSSFVGLNAQAPWDSGSADTPCQTPTHRGGKCKQIRSCPVILSLLTTSPMTPPVQEFLRRSQCGKYGNQPKVCCPESQIVEPVESPRAVQPNSLIPDTLICGGGSDVRIFGGNVTEIYDFPWMALLEYTKPVGKGFYCGGVLISSRYILTAAHCIKGKGVPREYHLTSVRLGEWNTETDPDCTSDGLCSDPAIDVPVEKIIVHEGYNALDKNQYNDIALLRLQRTVTFTDWIKPICLTIFDQRLLDKDYVDYDMHVSGWGKTETDSESDFKLKVRLPVKTQNVCQKQYKKARVVIGLGQFCAGGQIGRDSCSGDSGGPIMFNDVYQGAANWYVYGVVSFGPAKCGTQGWPGVYTRIGSYGNWIMENIKA